jgi:hypothetical protein
MIALVCFSVYYLFTSGIRYTVYFHSKDAVERRYEEFRVSINLFSLCGIWMGLVVAENAIAVLGYLIVGGSIALARYVLDTRCPERPKYKAPEQKPATKRQASSGRTTKPSGKRTATTARRKAS